MGDAYTTAARRCVCIANHRHLYMQTIEEATDAAKKTTMVGAVIFIIYCIMSKYFIIGDSKQEGKVDGEVGGKEKYTNSRFFTKYLQNYKNTGLKVGDYLQILKTMHLDY
jgi:hypothetical protein